jgi:hypothetical protein
LGLGLVLSYLVLFRLRFFMRNLNLSYLTTMGLDITSYARIFTTLLDTAVRARCEYDSGEEDQDTDIDKKTKYVWSIPPSNRPDVEASSSQQFLRILDG